MANYFIQVLIGFLATCGRSTEAGVKIRELERHFVKLGKGTSQRVNPLIITLCCFPHFPLNQLVPSILERLKTS